MKTVRRLRRGPAPRRDDGRRIDAARFPALQALLRGYLHEDHEVEYGSAAAAVAAFAADALPAERRAVAREWRRFSAITEAWPLSDLRIALTRDLGSAWHPATRRDVERAFARMTGAAA